MLRGKNMKLDAVIELQVDEAALLARIARRAAETHAAGGVVRADDNPEAFKIRLDAYRAQTAAVSSYFAQTGRLRTVDGMQPIERVSAAIDSELAHALA
jgi:adenylate kinase